MITIASFNCNGIRARLPVLESWLEENRPDLLCLQETKVQDRDFPQAPLAELGYQVYFRGQKSYNGVALLSRRPLEGVVCDFPGDGEGAEARVIAGRLGDLWVLNTYVPQGRDPNDPAFQYKLRFLERVRRWLEEEFSPEGLLLWTGDLNVAPGPLDVFDPQRLEGQVGFHPQEREALARMMDWGLVDLFRLHHPDQKQFTFWDYRLPKSFARNLGWRIDHMLATRPLAELCRDCWVDDRPRGEPKPSDHTFLLARFDLG